MKCDILPQGHIFVFGSNESGIHGAGAARYALDHLGAKWGQAEGIMGLSYGIPTKGKSVKRTLHPDDIQKYVQKFKFYAAGHLEDTFQVTQIGCGLAGLRPDQIAPMFIGSPLNCWFDTVWFKWLGPTYKYWGHL